MKNIINKLFVYLALVSTVVFTNCENAENSITEELTIQEKIELLENSEWLSPRGDNEPNVMHKFSEGERFTSYKSRGVWHENSIRPSADYITEGDLLTMNFYFGNVYTYDIEFSCDNNIVKFFLDGELHNTHVKRNSNYKDCLE